MPRVTIKAGGSHSFDEPGEAASFLEQFLERAGYSKDLYWEARIERTGQTPWDSPPVRIIGFKHWVIYVRVKPTIDATVDHFMSLLIPDNSGYSAEEVYRQLKSNVKSFNRFVRTHGARQKATEPGMTTDELPTVQSNLSTQTPVAEREQSPPPAAAAAAPVPASTPSPLPAPAPAPSAPQRPVLDAASSGLEFETLTGVTRHPEKLRYVLTFIDHVSKLEPGSAMGFKKALRKAAGWSNQPIRAVALVLAWLCKHDYVSKVCDDHDQVINYRLTPRGGALALAGLGAASGPVPGSTGVPSGARTRDEPRPAARALPDLDPGTLLIRFREKAQELADAGRRLEANREKYREMQANLKQLDEEYNEIARILVANREASALLSRLLELQGSVPMRS
jgi:hypothetical protein